MPKTATCDQNVEPASLAVKSRRRKGGQKASDSSRHIRQKGACLEPTSSDDRVARRVHNSRYRGPGSRANAPSVTPLSPLKNSGSFRIVAQHFEVFGAANRPEFRFLDLLIPWIFVVSLFGFLAAWLIIAILEHTGLTRHIWHLPLFFLALVVLLSSIIGFFCFP
jgi:hypothetical protein